MKMKHIAALALMMGWYLIVPPTTRIWWFGPVRTENSAQMSRWTIEQSFDKALQCQNARLTNERRSADEAIRMGNAVCIASDDPRLNSPI
jgi:hypothetical protein